MLVGLTGCDRDSEAGVRETLEAWFYMGQTRYFDSRRRCTAAVFSVRVDRPRPELEVQDNLAAAMAAMRSSGFGAIRMADYSPNDLTDNMLLEGDGAFGSQVLGTAAQAGDCTDDDTARQQVLEALTRKGATLVYDSSHGALVVLDPARMRVIYMEGEPW